MIAPIITALKITVLYANAPHVYGIQVFARPQNRPNNMACVSEIVIVFPPFQVPLLNIWKCLLDHIQ